LLREVDGDPILILRLDTPRDIYQLGQKSIAYIVGAFIIIGLFSSLMVFTILERSVLSPISTLKTEIERIQHTGATNDRFKADSLKNEFHKLGVAINGMLTSLEKSDEALRTRTQELEQMNSLMLGRELKMSELKAKNTILEKELNKGV
jgi:nitrate/nitrite-specific signal transduction histidine kinase